MAKDLEFESDRYEKRQSIKRWLIPAAALLGVIAVAVAVALLLRVSRGESFAGGEDTLYPYRWTENKNGTVSLELDHAAAPGSRWTAPEDAPDLAVETSQGDGSTAFTLTPRAQGRNLLTFVLRDAEGERLYERYVLTDASYEGKTLALRLAGVEGRQFTGTIRGGEDTPFPYWIRSDGNGDLLITVMDAARSEDGEEEVRGIPESIPEDETAEGIEPSGTPGSDWRCESGDEAAAAVLGVISGEDGVTAYLRPGTAAGSAWVRMYDDFTGASLTLEVASDGRGGLEVLSHRMRVGGG